MNLHGKKQKRVLLIVIAVILVLAMVVPMVASLLSVAA